MRILFLGLSLALLRTAQPHDWHPERVEKPFVFAALAATAVTNAPSAPAAVRPMAAAFMPFKPRLSFRWDATYFYVESDGLPAHNMMVGITAWQQQVPIPQFYFGANAWRWPLNPTPAANPAMIDANTFTRGAI